MYVYRSVFEHVIRKSIDSRMIGLCNGDYYFDQNNSQRNSWEGGSLYAWKKIDQKSKEKDVELSEATEKKSKVFLSTLNIYSKKPTVVLLKNIKIQTREGAVQKKMSRR